MIEYETFIVSESSLPSVSQKTDASAIKRL